MNDKEEPKKEQRMVNCYCGQQHPAEVKGDQNQILEWTCTKTGKVCCGVNIYN